MILPSKHIPAPRSLAGIGADILRSLDTPKTVSEAWTRTKTLRADYSIPLTFDWFILALSWLYAISAIEYHDNVLTRRNSL
jgi:hypothetical protein